MDATKTDLLKNNENIQNIGRYAHPHNILSTKLDKEYLDNLNQQVNDKENIIGKDTYKMYFIYRNLGFTYGVNNYNQLNDTAKKIVNNPNLAKTELMQNYLKFFSYDKKHSVSETIAKDIIKKILF